jgi:sporulation protein YlmC with PRC-barrel domain
VAEGLLGFAPEFKTFMATNQFENSRVADSTLQPGAQHDGTAFNESKAISRDDVRDGVAPPEDAREGAFPTTARPRTRRILTASTLTGDRVRNPAGDNLGSIEEIMLDLESGRIAYAVLSFGGFLGIGDKLFAVPWSTLRVDQGEHEFVLDIDRAALEKAPGFDKDNWPDMADPAFGREIHQHCGQTPYWEHTVTDAGDFTGERNVADRSRESEPTIGYQSASKH